MTPLLVCLVLAQKPALAPLSARIAEEREAYRIDPKRVFYATPELRKADEARVDALRASLQELRGKIAASKENLLRALTLGDEIEALGARLGIASTVEVLLDGRKAGRATREGDGEVTENTFEGELAAVEPPAFDAFVTAEPHLAPYRYRLEALRRARSHRLPPCDEALLARLRPSSDGWQGRLFESLRREKTTPAIKDALAVGLTNLATFRTTEARLRGFGDAVDAYLFDLDLRRTQTDALLKGLAAQLSLVAQIRRGGNAEAPPPFTLAEATRIVRDALAPLGPEYAKEMAELLDPKNGRIDVAGGPYRAGLGTGWGFPASQPSILYWPEYTGVYDDLDRGLAHEGGHAVHFQFMRANRVLPAYSNGPGYFFESFAEFNQLLLADFLYRREKEPRHRLFYLRQFLEKAAYPIRLSLYPALEFSIYDGVAKGEITNAQGLDATETAALRDYGVPGTAFSAESPTWTKNETFYTHPLYNINHVLGAALADAYYVRYQRDPKGFVPRYLALLRNGFDASPNDLLRRFLGFDLDDPSLGTVGGELVKGRLDEYKRLVGSP